jgi:hypothetical protein
MSGASWPAAAWKPREAKEGAACRESVSWADGAKRVRRCFPTQKAGLPLPSDHSLVWVHLAWSPQFTNNGTRAASPAGGEQLSGPRVAQPIVRRLQQ